MCLGFWRACFRCVLFRSSTKQTKLAGTHSAQQFTNKTVYTGQKTCSHTTHTHNAAPSDSGNGQCRRLPAPVRAARFARGDSRPAPRAARGAREQVLRGVRDARQPAMRARQRDGGAALAAGVSRRRHEGGGGGGGVLLCHRAARLRRPPDVPVLRLSQGAKQNCRCYLSSECAMLFENRWT